jgi:dipeptidyl aminopeptidase/acylaminoacyl peptidase
MKKSLLYVAAFLFSNFSIGQSLMTPETLWKFGRVAEPKVSPDGKLVVYQITTYSIDENKGSTDLWLIPSTGGSAKQLTATPISENNARWRPDGKKIGYLSAASGEMQLWEMNIDGSQQKQISNFPGGIANFNYSPTQKHIYFTQDVKLDKSLLDRYPDLPKANAKMYDGLNMRHWNQWEDEMYSHVMFATYDDGQLGKAIDIMPNERYDTPTLPFGGEEQLNWSPDGKRIAYTCKKEWGTAYATSTNTDIYIYDIAKDSTQNLTVNNLGYDVDPSFSPDGKMIAWLSMERPGFEADKNRLMICDLQSGTITEASKYIDQSVDNILWSKDSKFIYFSSCINAVHQVYAYNVSAKKDAMRRITNTSSDLGGLGLGFDGKKYHLVATHVNMSSPTELYKIDIRSGEQLPLTHANDAILSSLKLGVVEKRMVTTTDSLDMLVWVIYPPNFDKTKKYPSLLVCQGGPQSTISQNFSYRWNFQLMAAQGYIVIAPNRRGLPSFGQSWNDQISGDWGGQAMLDLLSAVDEISEEPFIDKDRRAAVGASFGGYSVYWLAGHHNKRFKSFIAHCGVFNLESMYGATEEIFFSNFDMGGPYWKQPQPKSYEAFSPHKFVQNWNTPILVIHNEKDFRVPLGEGLQAYSAAQLQGIKSRFLYFADEGHWVTKPQNSILWQREFYRWLDETVK